MSNEGAIKERWRIEFTSSSTFKVVGETIGQIATGTIGNDLLVTNSLTEKAMFELFADGWGSGWSTGNVIRFNTEAASAPIWVARCIESGQATEEADEFAVQVRGDAD